uniref:Uncharacterized protein n=1 Tax=Molossus molossus TaxID=27622 RepID=A0A7J8I9K8_MOLMO|nr:hypothetical protein HJG59_010591 [Molossus molossus]
METPNFLDNGAVTKVYFVPNQDDWHFLLWLHWDDLVPHGLNVLEPLLVDKTVDEHETLAVLDVQVPHGCNLLSTNRVQDLQHRWERVHLDLLAVEALDGGVLFLDEGTGHELHGQGGSADPTGAQHHHFVLTHLPSAAAATARDIVLCLLHCIPRTLPLRPSLTPPPHCHCSPQGTGGGSNRHGRGWGGVGALRCTGRHWE